MRKLNEFFNESKYEGLIFDLSTTGRDDWDDDYKKHKNDIDIKFVDMTPQEFLEKSDSKRYKLDKNKVDGYIEMLNQGKITDIPAPTLDYSSEWAFKHAKYSNFHDGMHRVAALQKYGVRKIPVRIVIWKDSFSNSAASKPQFAIK